MWLIFSLFVFASAAAPFEATISAPTKRLTNDASYFVDFSLTNTNDLPITVCIWGTPLDKSNDVLRANMFNIVTELGVSAVYTGILMKRRLVESDLVVLQPNETISAKVDLLKGYWFPKDGKYFISLNSYINVYASEEQLCKIKLAALGLDAFQTFDLTTDEVLPLTVVDVIEEPKWGAGSNDHNLGQVTTVNCDTNNATAIRTADTNAITIAGRVRTSMSNTGCGSIYQKWMGACNTGRQQTVTTNFNNIYARLNNGYRVDCRGSSCSANTFAYVYPTDTSYTVYVCGAFWTASASICGSNGPYDTRAGTMVHEISHFSNVAGTSDIAYGTSACLNLATSNPANAVRNADSHEYFAENCP